MDAAIAKATGEEFDLGRSIVVNGAVNLATGGLGGKVTKIGKLGKALVTVAADTMASTAYDVAVEGQPVAESAVSNAAASLAGQLMGEALEGLVRPAVASARSALDSGGKFWKKSTAFDGRTVYQRDDLIDPRLVTNGRTNLERMSGGNAPYGPDGERVELHHMLQTESGPLAEVSGTFADRYKSTIHINPNAWGTGIGRNSFKTYRRAYWQHRAGDFQPE